MINFITGVLKETVSLFIEMTPYILFGVVIAGILSVYVNKKICCKTYRRGILSLQYSKQRFSAFRFHCVHAELYRQLFILSRPGASKPAAMSFLISTPQTGVDSIIATYGMLGPFFCSFQTCCSAPYRYVGRFVKSCF